MKRLALLAFFASAVLLAAFTVRLTNIPSLPTSHFNYANIVLPGHFDDQAILASDNTPAGNPVTDAGATLGRVLFYDTRLSVDETIACASCHFQTLGFADPDSVSTGVFDSLGTRNAMALANIRYYARGRFLWDEAGRTLEEQTLFPIELPSEMGSTLELTITRLDATTFYPDLFADAFGTPDITSERMGQALAQFIRSIVSFRTRFDTGRATVGSMRDDFPNFTVQENEGKTLFSGRAMCFRCHTTDVMIAEHPSSNGLDSMTTDPGVGEVTGNPAHDGTFKVPSLRNVALTAPYMHDGRFATLEEVVEHYDSGIQPHPNLNFALRDGRDPEHPPIRLNLSESEKSSLVTFLSTLTDEEMTADVRWSNPFTPLAVAATPFNIIVPATGGTVNADIDIINTGLDPIDFTVRVDATLATGVTRPVNDQRDRIRTVQPGQTRTYHWSYEVAANEPTGIRAVMVSVMESAENFGVGATFTYEKEAPSAAFMAEHSSATSVNGIPTSFRIHAVFPNPFNQSVIVRFDIPEAVGVTVEVVEILGRRIAVLTDGPLRAGTHQVQWEPANVPAGVYFVRVRTSDNQVSIQRVTLVR